MSMLRIARFGTRVWQQVQAHYVEVVNGSVLETSTHVREGERPLGGYKQY